MMQIKLCLGIFFCLAISRLIPHPPNFTSLIALSFYIPALLGLRFLPVLLFSFFITDLIIGYHSITHWTWGSVIFIGMMTLIFPKNIFSRIGGSLIGACIFFLFTNFGVWLSGVYEQNLKGLQECYILALPFFISSLSSTLIFSLIFELIYKIIKTSRYSERVFK